MRWKSILALCFLAPVLTELLSTNVPIFQFINPLTYLFFATLGYGIPVLLIRESAVRHKIGIPGLALMGMAYGIYNEGLIARTFLTAAPVHQFEGYGFVGGIAVPWALTISFWHALFAVIIPIMLVHYLLPKEVGEQWIGKKAHATLAILIVLFGSFAFLTPSNSATGTIGQLAALLLMGVLLFLAARFLPDSVRESQGRIGHGFLGIGMLIMTLLIPFTLAGSASLPLFYFTALASMVITVFMLHRMGDGARRMSAVGLIMGMAFFAIVLGVSSGSWERILSSVGFIILAAISIYRLRN
jgi:hypothetical protein